MARWRHERYTHRSGRTDVENRVVFHRYINMRYGKCEIELRIIGKNHYGFKIQEETAYQGNRRAISKGWNEEEIKDSV